MVMTRSSVPRRRGGLDERRRRVKRGCGEVWSLVVVGTADSINRLQPQACLGRNSARLPIVSPPPPPPLGQASREDWPSEPTPTPTPHSGLSGPFSLEHPGSSGQNPLGHDHDIVSKARSGDTASFRESGAKRVCASPSRCTARAEWVGRKERRCRKQENRLLGGHDE